jgi:hypothetical protein
MHLGRVRRQIRGRRGLCALREVAHWLGNQQVAAACRCRAGPSLVARGPQEGADVLVSRCPSSTISLVWDAAAGKGHIID